MDALRDIVSVLQTWWENPVRAIAGIVGLAVFAWSVWPVVQRSEAGPGDSITIHGDVNAPSQIGGRGNVQNINLPAYFERVEVERPQQDTRRAVVRFVPTPGRSWGAGITPRFEIGLNRACEGWDVDLTPWQPEVAPGVRSGSIRGDTRYLRQQDGIHYIGFSIGDPPQPGMPVVFTITCAEPVEVVSATASPSAP